MKTLSEAEWHIMESLWEESPKVGSRIVADMGGGGPDGAGVPP